MTEDDSIRLEPDLCSQNVTGCSGATRTVSGSFSRSFAKQNGGNERRQSFASKERRAGPQEVRRIEVLHENTLKSHLVAENRQSAFISSDPILRDTEDHVVVLQGRDDVSIHLQ